MLQMVIKLLRRLEEGHLRFLDLKKKKKKVVRAHTTAISNDNLIRAIFLRPEVQ